MSMKVFVESCAEMHLPVQQLIILDMDFEEIGWQMCNKFYSSSQILDSFCSSLI